ERGGHLDPTRQHQRDRGSTVQPPGSNGARSAHEVHEHTAPHAGATAPGGDTAATCGCEAYGDVTAARTDAISATSTTGCLLRHEGNLYGVRGGDRYSNPVGVLSKRHHAGVRVEHPCPQLHLRSLRTCPGPPRR